MQNALEKGTLQNQRALTDNRQPTTYPPTIFALTDRVPTTDLETVYSQPVDTDSSTTDY